MLTTLVGQITEVDSVDDQCLDVTIYVTGTNQNESFECSYNDMTPEEKATVDNFRALMIAKAPSNNP